jgi:hypothetical protein
LQERAAHRRNLCPGNRLLQRLRKPAAASGFPPLKLPVIRKYYRDTTNMICQSVQYINKVIDFKVKIVYYFQIYK